MISVVKTGSTLVFFALLESNYSNFFQLTDLGIESGSPRVDTPPPRLSSALFSREMPHFCEFDAPSFLTIFIIAHCSHFTYAAAHQPTRTVSTFEYGAAAKRARNFSLAPVAEI